MKLFRILFLVLTMMALLCACSSKEGALVPSTSEYSEKEDFLIFGIYVYSESDNTDVSDSSDFKITIREDGSYSYVESVAASSVTSGTWTVSDGKLVLSDVAGINYFNIEKDKLTFISDCSDNFRMVKLREGDSFTLNK